MPVENRILLGSKFTQRHLVQSGLSQQHGLILKLMNYLSTSSTTHNRMEELGDDIDKVQNLALNYHGRPGIPQIHSHGGDCVPEV